MVSPALKLKGKTVTTTTFGGQTGLWGQLALAPPAIRAASISLPTTGNSTPIISLPAATLHPVLLFPLLQIRMVTLGYSSSRHDGLVLVFFVSLTLSLLPNSFSYNWHTHRPPFLTEAISGTPQQKKKPSLCFPSYIHHHERESDL